MPVKASVVKVIKDLKNLAKNQYKSKVDDVLALYQAQVLRADTAENVARMLVGPRNTAEAGIRKLNKVSGKPTMKGRLTSGKPGRVAIRNYMVKGTVWTTTEYSHKTKKGDTRVYKYEDEPHPMAM